MAVREVVRGQAVIVTHLLGHGGFGHVYRGTLEKSGKTIAIKAFAGARNPDVQRAHAHEVEMLRFCQHISIAKLFGVDIVKDTLLIMLELYVGAFKQMLNPDLLEYFAYTHLFRLSSPRYGGDVHKFLAVQDYLPEYHAKVILFHILRGLQFLHDRGISHRDMKPGNVLIEDSTNIEKSRIVISDLGLASRSQWMSDLAYVFMLLLYTFELKLTGPTLSPIDSGTPQYIAPEVYRAQLVPGARYTTSADMFSVGVIAHALVSHRCPSSTLPLHSREEMAAVTLDELDHALIWPCDNPKFRGRFTDGVSRDYLGLTMALLDMDPARRYDMVVFTFKSRDYLRQLTPTARDALDDALFKHHGDHFYQQYARATFKFPGAGPAVPARADDAVVTKKGKRMKHGIELCIAARVSSNELHANAGLQHPHQQPVIVPGNAHLAPGQPAIQVEPPVLDHPPAQDQSALDPVADTVPAVIDPVANEEEQRAREQEQEQQQQPKLAAADHEPLGEKQDLAVKAENDKVTVTDSPASTNSSTPAPTAAAAETSAAPRTAAERANDKKTRVAAAAAAAVTETGNAPRRTSTASSSAIATGSVKGNGILSRHRLCGSGKCMTVLAATAASGVAAQVGANGPRGLSMSFAGRGPANANGNGNATQAGAAGATETGNASAPRPQTERISPLASPTGATAPAAPAATRNVPDATHGAAVAAAPAVVHRLPSRRA
ncbi:hypothetical protein GGF32_009969 [Allomyces javanicus]|nr:hypothetical protein GGF32_009969 [Allomyces javanicus]